MQCNAILAVEERWWEYGHFYQILPHSFQDSNGDGIGDLNGIIYRLPYLKYIGVTGIWLSPIFQSPMLDFGYDITNFRKINVNYGTMMDFENLIKRCKELDIKLILDFVPNHTSDQHAWFKKSSNPHHPEFKKYKDYYVWNKGKRLANGTRIPPSNWQRFVLVFYMKYSYTFNYCVELKTKIFVYFTKEKLHGLKPRIYFIHYTYLLVKLRG